MHQIMLGMPGSSFCFGSIRAAIEASEKHTVGVDNSGNGFDDMDILWTLALERASLGEITHFAMLHSDISPETGWLDRLVDECDRLDADLVSAVVPLKDFRGVTSTGISGPEDQWGGFRRFTVKELPSLPKTFNASDAGYGDWPLLINTGCFIADLRKQVFFTTDQGEALVNFNFPRKTYREGGGWKMLRESEDWHLSRCLHRLKARYYATSRIQVKHMASHVAFQNWGAWGEEHDEETRPLWERGPMTHLDIPGWFDFADLYGDQVRSVNGSPAHFVEVGSWLGKSAAYMAKRIAESKKQIRFDAIDNWAGGQDERYNGLATRDRVAASGRDLFSSWSRNLTSVGAAEYVRPVRASSPEAADGYADNSLDFVFIDGDHRPAAVHDDLSAWFPKIKAGGTLAGHDFDEDGPKEAATRFAREKALNIREEGRCFVIQKL